METNVRRSNNQAYLVVSPEVHLSKLPPMPILLLESKVLDAGEIRLELTKFSHIGVYVDRQQLLVNIGGNNIIGEYFERVAGSHLPPELMRDWNINVHRIALFDEPNDSISDVPLTILRISCQRFAEMMWIFLVVPGSKNIKSARVCQILKKAGDRRYRAAKIESFVPNPL